MQGIPVPPSIDMGATPAPPHDYEYDLFISYRRRLVLEEWLGENEFFTFLLTDYLEQELTWRPRIFRDVTRIRTGDDWSSVIETALWTSKCLLAVGTGDYFASAWCAAEFEAFRERSVLAGRSVLVPIAWHDWQPVPQQASQWDVSSFHDYAFIGAKGDPHLCVPFQRRVKQLAQDIAQKILEAPSFDSVRRPVVPRVDSIRSPRIQRPRG